MCINFYPIGTVTNIPQGMVTDQFGMVGLLTFIRTAEIDPNLVALAPGIDLTTLGLNLNSPEWVKSNAAGILEIIYRYLYMFWCAFASIVIYIYLYF